MNMLWLLAAGVLLAFFALLFRRRPGRADVPVRPAPASRSALEGGMPAATVVEPKGREPAALQPPPALLAFRPTHAQDLSAPLQQAMFGIFREVPRPPRLLQQLLSPEFLNSASSAQLVDLIAAEPLIAAKLMAAVNSPMYGLQRPASGIEQAVIYLGVNTVRSICMQYLLLASFKADESARAQRLETTWLASGLASEMAQHLCQAMFMESSGATVSALVLSFLGRLAIEGATPMPVLAKIPAGDFLARSVAEQEALGVCASEVGRLLMTQWNLPAAIIGDAADIDGVLTRPADPGQPDRDALLALAYFCARAGERLADGRLKTFPGLALMDDSPAEFFHLRSYLGHPWLRNLEEAAKSPALADRLQRMLEAVRH